MYTANNNLVFAVVSINQSRIMNEYMNFDLQIDDPMSDQIY